MKKTLTTIFAFALLAVFLTGCTDTPASGESSQRTEQLKTEENQLGLRSKYPVKKLDNSLELENLNRRLDFVNKSDRVSYIYLVNYGKVMAFYPLKGKVSSLNSYSTTMQQLVDADGNPCSRDKEYGPNSNHQCYTVEAPDIDGSYGSNGEGIFFFTTDGTYVEWRGDYMLASEPLKLSTQPELVREIK